MLVGAAVRPKSATLGIRVAIVILLQLICAVVGVSADEKLPVLEVGAKTYTNVTVTAVTATDIYFKYDNGVANAKLRDLDSALQKRFHFDPKRAEAAKAQAAEASPLSAISKATITRKNAQAVMDEATARVKAIINQPVRQLPRTADMEVREFSQGWFHPGATKPDFKTVDVRTTQDTKNYDKPYVTSDLNPGVVFVGFEIEFNSMTKYFYTDRSLPKKRLTEAEMLEINRLYRIIGTCEEKLQPFSEQALGYVSTHKNVATGCVLSLGVLLLLIRVFRSKQS